MKVVVAYPFAILAQIFLLRRRNAKAEKMYRRALVIHPEQPSWNVRMAALLRHKKSFKEALHFYDVASRISPSRASAHFGRAKCLMALKKSDEAADALEAAIRFAPENAPYYDHLASVMRKQGKTWREIEALEQIIALGNATPSSYFRLGEAYDLMGDTARSEGAYAKAVRMEPKHATWHYRLGRAAELNGNREISQAAYSSAIARDRTLNAKRYGIGAFHQSREEWDLARDAYAARVNSVPADAGLYARYANALTKCSQWAEALDQYYFAVYITPKNSGWHYQIGLCLEKLGEWEKAAAAYTHAIDLREKHTASWYYRAGYVYHRLGDWRSSVDCLLMTSPAYQANIEVEPDRSLIDQESESASGVSVAGYLADLRAAALRLISDPGVVAHARSATHFFSLAEVACQHGDHQAAIRQYRAAIDRENEHRPELYYKLGRALAHLGKYEEASEVLLNIKQMRSAHGLDEASYRAKETLWKTSCYREYYDNLVLRDDCILYESFAGRSIACNPYALFMSALQGRRFSGFLHVWSVEDLKKVPEDLAKLENVVFVKRESDLYLRYLASAKYLINNATFPSYYVRKNGQCYLNTWHGTPWKTLGTDMKGRFLEHKTFARNILQATHLLSPNSHTTEIISERQGVSNTMSAKVVEAGYPRIDLTLDQSQSSRDRVFSRLGIPSDKPVVLYAPTWRGTLGGLDLDSTALLRDIEAFASNDYTLLFRGHSLQERVLAGLNIKCLANPEVDTNELLRVTDLLITDYSSILFDFAVLDRPIALYTYDLESYEADRGLYFPVSEVPGTACPTTGDVKSFILAHVGETESYGSFRDRFFPYEDGHASRRVWDELLSEASVPASGSSQRVLVYAGPFIPNGITSSALNLLHALNKDGFDVTLALEADSIADHPERLERVGQLPANISIYSRSGAMAMTLEERWNVEQFNQWHRFYSERMRKIYDSAFQFEFRRLFGTTKFDVSINFEGYVRLWASLFSIANADHRVIFLHNDMMQERLKRFAYLEGIFQSYSGYDKLVSVSETMSKVNAENLARVTKRDKFDFATNLIDFDKILQRADEGLDPQLDAWIGTRRCLVTLGRLSPEKDHAKLIAAFRTAASGLPDVCLVIAGDGPLESRLQRTIEDCGLAEKVKLAGMIANPFPLLKRADCFVLSSNHEGQPMVLLESLVLGKPIVATDIDGNRGALGEDRGLLVENSVDGLARGISLFLAGMVRPSTFDYIEYNKRSLEKFKSVIGGPVAKNVDPEGQVRNFSRLEHEGCQESGLRGTQAADRRAHRSRPAWGRGCHKATEPLV